MNTWSKYFAVYTLAFAILSLLVFSPFILGGYTFIWVFDGLDQHVKALTYYGAWLRSAAVGLIVGQGIPQFSFALGYGVDILGTLNYYVMGDPLNLIAAFVAAEYIPYLYTVLIVVRLYLAGFVFSLFIDYALKPTRQGLLGGAFTYVFCGFAVYAAVRHPFFVNPLVYFPLVLFGVEKVLREHKHLLFVLAIALCMVSNFYFFYMIFILMALYIVLRFFSMYRNRQKSGLQIAGLFGRLFGVGLIGVLLSCVVFFPVTLYFLQDQRSAVEHVIPLFYSPKYYASLLFGFTTNIGVGYWVFISLGMTSFLAATSLFFERKKHTQLKVMFVLCLILLCLPFAGQLLNGFSYISNRWCWAFCLVGAAVVALRWDALTKLSAKQAIILCAASVLYLLCCFALNSEGHYRVKCAIIILWFVAAFSAIGASYSHFRYPHAKRKCIAHGMLYAITCAGILLNAFVLYTPIWYNYVSEFVEQSEVKAMYETEAHTIASLKDDTFFRYSGLKNIITRNGGSLVGISSTSSFWSLSNASTGIFLKALGIDGQDSKGFSRYTLNGQSTIAELLGVKYYVAQQNAALPYNYNFVPIVKDSLYSPSANKAFEYGIYQNRNPLPFGFTYSKRIDEKLYNSLLPEQKRSIVLQACTTGARLEDNTLSSKALSSIEPINIDDISTWDYRDIPFTISGQDGLDAAHAVLKTGEEKQVITLNAVGLASSETTLQFTNLVLESDVRKDASIGVTFMYSDDSVQEGSIAIASKADSFYEPWPWLIFSPGYTEAPLEKIELSFPSKCTFTWDNLQVIAQPMDTFNNSVNALKENVLEDVDFHFFPFDIAATNYITGHISLEKPKILCTEIPFSKGWHVRVDGEEAELLPINTMLSGVALERGSHHIEFIYHTPGLSVGCILSLLGLVAFVALVFIERRYVGKS